MHTPPPLHLMDNLGPALGALAFIAIMSLVREPARRHFNAILVAGTCGTYLSGGGFGPWEMLYPALATGVVYLGLRSHRFIGLAWLLHAGWDLLHHRYGNAIWPFMPASSWGCMIFDSVIAVWFLAEAPSVFSSVVERRALRQPLASGGDITRRSA